MVISVNKYEYIQLNFDFGDLAQLNRLASEGWHVVFVTELRHRSHGSPFVALLERCNSVVQSR